jgi:poly(3-hydroxybutyrate) depolymerase
MAFWAACGELSRRLAGLALVNASVAAETPYAGGGRPDCRAEHPMPLVLVHGGPPHGPPPPCRPGFCPLSPEQLLDFWAHRNDPAQRGVLAPEPVFHGARGTQLFAPSPGVAPVELVSIAGGGHLFDSLDAQLARSGEPDVATLILRFLGPHRRDDFPAKETR